MGGSSIDEDWEFTSGNGVRTLVLVGCTGNGKSATGNSILGQKAFKSMSSPNGVTSMCELRRTVMDDGLILNVIDTPGLEYKALGEGRQVTFLAFYIQEGAKKLHDQTVEVNSLEGHSKQEILELKEQTQSSYDEQMNRITETPKVGSQVLCERSGISGCILRKIPDLCINIVYPGGVEARGDYIHAGTSIGRASVTDAFVGNTYRRRSRMSD